MAQFLVSGFTASDNYKSEHGVGTLFVEPLASEETFVLTVGSHGGIVNSSAKSVGVKLLLYIHYICKTVKIYVFH